VDLKAYVNSQHSRVAGWVDGFWGAGGGGGGAPMEILLYLFVDEFMLFFV